MPLLDPQTQQIASQASELAGEVLKGLPVLAVMWYMLKDVRLAVQHLTIKVVDLEKQIAGDRTAIDLEHLEKNFIAYKSDQRDTLDDVKTRLNDLEKQMPKIWVKIGDRPEDIKQRNGE